MAWYRQVQTPFSTCCLSHLEPKPGVRRCLYNLYTVLTFLITIAISCGSCILLHHPQQMDENRRFHRRFRVKRCKLDHLYIPNKHPNRAQQTVTGQCTPPWHDTYHLLATILSIVTKHKHTRWTYLSCLLRDRVFHTETGRRRWFRRVCVSSLLWVGPVDMCPKDCVCGLVWLC